MIRRQPRSTRTDTLFPYTTLFRSVLAWCMQSQNREQALSIIKQQGCVWEDVEKILSVDAAWGDGTILTLAQICLGFAAYTWMYSAAWGMYIVGAQPYAEEETRQKNVETPLVHLFFTDYRNTKAKHYNVLLPRTKLQPRHFVHTFPPAGTVCSTNVPAICQKVQKSDPALALDMSFQDSRAEERRVGKECVSTCRSRWSPIHKKK